MRILTATLLVLTLDLVVAGSRQSDANKTGGVEAARETGDSMVQQTPPRLSRSGYDITPLSRERVKALASKLEPEAYRVTQKAGTEAPFCGNLLDNHMDGTYFCVVCGLPLFSSQDKFNSGTGWPSFFREFDADHVARRPDGNLGMVRTEIDCARCGAHLGHVFDDGPAPTGLRYCLNSAALVFHAKGDPVPAESRPVRSGASASSSAQNDSLPAPLPADGSPGE